MSESFSAANKSSGKVPTRFLLRVGILIRETHGLPNPGFEFSKSNALALFLTLALARNEDEAKKLLLRDQAGTLALLAAMFSESLRNGLPLSLPDIAAAKIDDTEWVMKGFANADVLIFFRNAIDHLAEAGGKLAEIE